MIVYTGYLWCKREKRKISIAVGAKKKKRI